MTTVMKDDKPISGDVERCAGCGRTDIYKYGGKGQPLCEDCANGVPSSQRGKNGRRRPLIREPKIGRNEPCPCGSGIKYKKCCLPHKID